MERPDVRSLLLVLLLVAVALRQGLAVLLLGLLLVALGLAAAWGRWAWRRVSYSRALSAEHAFVGDEIVLTQRIENGKLLALPNVRIDETIPAALQWSSLHVFPHPRTDLRIVRRWAALRPYEALSWTATLLCTRRGAYRFGPTHLRASDALGLHERELDLTDQTQLVVYPQLITLPPLRLQARQPMGDTRANRRAITDPSRTVGVRDYHRDDPFNAIHWGATARRGELQTRLFEPTTNLSLAIMLDLDTFEYYWEGVRYDLVEQMISAAATIAADAAAARLTFGLYSNGALADSGQLVRIPPNRSPAQLSIVLDTLGRLSPHSVARMGDLLLRLGPTLEWGSTIVLISAVPSEAHQRALLRLTRGRRIIWLYGGDAPAPTVPGVEVVPWLRADDRWADRRAGTMTVAAAQHP